MMIGLPAMVYPSGSKLSRFERLPSWKIQTSAPKLAVIESRVMMTALIGMHDRPEQQEQDQAAGEQRQPDGVRRALGLRDEEVVADRGAAADLGRDARRRRRSRG